MKRTAGGIKSFAVASLLVVAAILPDRRAAGSEPMFSFNFNFASSISATFSPFVMANAFTTNDDVFITHIGLWDIHGDGLTEDHPFRIYDEDSGVDLVSTTILAGSGTLVDGFRYVDIPDLSVPANRRLIAVSHEPNLLQLNSDQHAYNLGLADVSYSPLVTFRRAGSQNNAGIETNLPALQLAIIAGPNVLMAAVPEPGTLLIATCASAVGMFSPRRKRCKRIAGD